MNIAGPVVQINSPAPDSRHKTSLSVQAIVAHKYELTLFEARIGAVKLELTEKDLGNDRKMFSGTVKFDEGFTPPLSGKQVLIVVAENENGARVTIERIFHVDDQGPEITINSQSPG